MSPNQLSTPAVANGALGSQPLASQGETPAASSSNASEFARRLEQFRAQGKEQSAAPVSNVASATDANSLGSRVMDNVAQMSSRLASEHKKLSDAVNRAMVTGDSALMTQAAAAINEHLQRVNLATKVVASTARGLEALTRLQ